MNWRLVMDVITKTNGYSSNTTFKESDTSARTNNYFKSFTYTDDFTTKGIGIAARLGVIYRPKEYIRLGLAVHSPMFMGLTDKRTTTLSTQLENPVAAFNTTSQTFTNNQPGESNYLQSSPWKIIGSASYVFREVANTKRQRAFITADIEYVQHRGSRFGSDNEDAGENEKAYFRELNKVVKGEYKGAFNFRVGGELKFNTIMGRLGFAHYGNPYKETAYKANRMLLSGGLGYRNKGVFVDVTYVHAITKDVDLPYRLSDRANTFASLKQQRGTVMATVGFKF
jgi:long-subunit fatty acid transport protein